MLTKFFLLALTALTAMPVPSLAQGTSAQQDSIQKDFEYSKLEQIATQSLTQTIRKLPSGLYMSAGDLRLKAFWIRDFSFAAAGLHAIHRDDVIQSHLGHTFDMIRESDGCLPRTFGGKTPGWLLQLQRWFGLPRNNPRDPLVPTYGAGGGGKETIDSNALALIAATDYLRWTGDHAWWSLHLPQMVKAYRYYDQRISDGLIVQGDYADWQDSVKRHGHVFFTNLAYYIASERLAQYPEFEIRSDDLLRLKQRLISEFFVPVDGLFHSLKGEPYVSLEDNLLVISWGFYAAKSQAAVDLFTHLKANPLWTKNGVPGFSTYPDYPDHWIGSHDKPQGLRHYHDSLVWSWLMGLSAKVAREMGDTESAHQILAALQDIAVRDKSIAEVYWPTPGFPRWSSAFLKSERPFAWGSGVILDALSTPESL